MYDFNDNVWLEKQLQGQDGGVWETINPDKSHSQNQKVKVGQSFWLVGDNLLNQLVGLSVKI